MSLSHVYVHVPFCARKCSYCDFAIAVRRTVPVDEFVGSLQREIVLRYPHSGAESPPLQTLYLGGGTPSRLGADGVQRVIDLARARWGLDDRGEVTIEANPDDVRPEDARRWREAGVNRVSLGVQSFSGEALGWMHRTHDVDAVARAVEALRGAGIADYSVDLIFALPSSVERDWQADLAAAIALQPTHISLYGLTIEPMTPLGRRQGRGETVEAPEERYEAEYLAAHDALGAAGFVHYEVSNFAQPGHRARHNSAYWRGVSYAGLGPGAHELNGDLRRWNAREYTDWVRRLLAGTDPMAGSETLSEANKLAEAVYLGLRTTDGLRLEGAEPEQLSRWVAAGWGTITHEGRLVLSPLGWLRLDGLSADVAHRRSRD